MKKLLKYLLIICVIFSPFRSISAQETEDMSKWSFKILLQHADQLDELKVVRFYNKESGKYGFCMEAGVDYDPKNSIYSKEEIEDEVVFDIVKAYEILGEDYYIAAQLMIWENRSGIRYSFDGKDAADFGEEKIKEMIESFEKDEEELVYETTAEKERDNEVILSDLDEYRLLDSNLENVRIQNDRILYDLPDEKQGPYHISLVSKRKETEGSFLYHSDTSQDLFSFEGSIVKRKDIRIMINTETETASIRFTKRDMNEDAISGAEFTLYQLDENGDQILNIALKGSKIDMNALLKDAALDEDIKVTVSERYQKYLNGTVLEAAECGYFDYEIHSLDSEETGRVYICEDDQVCSKEMNRYRVHEVGKYISLNADKNVIEGLQKDKKYILCESHPKNGYVFESDPCMFIDLKSDPDKNYHFVNRIRSYDLRLYKENEDHSILLNGAKFRIRYQDGGDIKERIYVTGAICIRQNDDKRYVLYRREKDENIYIGEFKDGYFIKTDMIPGTYYYLVTDDININDRSLLKEEIKVILGGFEIEDMPYESLIEAEELEAPKGYFIDEPVYEIVPDLDYSEIIFRNYRVNSFIMIPEQKRKIPKTCIGD